MPEKIDQTTDDETDRVILELDNKGALPYYLEGTKMENFSV